MAYSELFADRIKQILDDKDITYITKKMMGGLCFMVDDKMLCGIVRNELMARIGSDAYEEALAKEGCKEMTFTGRSMKGYVFLEDEATDMDEDLEYWIQLCLDFNPLAQSSKRKTKK
ncbi:MAG: TfoX/Sxy family protein [Chitinophagales bacterium]